MLEKIVKIDGVGIFHSGAPAARDLEKITLIYADNARGKSTLSAILKACSTGDAAAITSRATIGGNRAAAVHLRFNDGTTARSLKYENGAWDGAAGQVHVFDNAFVETNVYAASEVNTSQHEALLDFALGVAAVAKRHEVEKHGDAQTAATRARTDAENKLAGHRGNTALPIFTMLAEDDGADAKISALEQRLTNTRQAELLNARPKLSEDPAQEFDWAPVESVLAATFKQIQEGASAVVHAHFDSTRWSGVSRWAEEGHQHKPDSGACPYCGQSTEGIELIKAYDTYFNQAYKDHLSSIGELTRRPDQMLPAKLIQAWTASAITNSERVQAWRPQLELNVALLDVKHLAELAEVVRSTLAAAADRKAAAPLEALDVAVLLPAKDAAKQISTMQADYLASVSEANKAIDAFRAGLAAEDDAQLQRQIDRLKLGKFVIPRKLINS